MATWQPDSCGCIIEVTENWQPVSFTNKCPAHSALSDQQAWDAIWRPDNKGENQRGPSNTIDEMARAAPAGAVDVNGNGTVTFKQGINVTWNWSGTAPNRVLNINVTGFTPTANQQNAITTKLNTRFGAGNVVVTYG